MTPDVERLTAALARPSGDSSDFDLNPAQDLPRGPGLRPAAVLIAVVERGGRGQVILTKRASHLRYHPGQIAFPGGKQEAYDIGPEAAALREAQEEIGLLPENLRVLGQLPAHETVTGFSVIPTLAVVRRDLPFHPDPGEVEEVFTVPLAHLMDTGRYSVEQRLWRGNWRRYYAVPYGPYYIWGATARILRGLAERMQPW